VLSVGLLIGCNLFRKDKNGILNRMIVLKRSKGHLKIPFIILPKLKGKLYSVSKCGPSHWNFLIYKPFAEPKTKVKDLPNLLETGSVLLA